MAFALHQGTHHPRLQLKHDKTIKYQQQFNSTPITSWETFRKRV